MVPVVLNKKSTLVSKWCFPGLQLAICEMEGERDGGTRFEQSLYRCRRFRGETPAFFCLPTNTVVKFRSTSVTSRQTDNIRSL
jgi:hypothetical protein